VRIRRHNDVVNKLARAIEAQGGVVIKERRIVCEEGNFQPDILWKAPNGNGYVTDVQISGDSRSEVAFKEKVSKYDRVGINQAVQRLLNCKNVRHLPAIISRRGMLNLDSGNGLSLEAGLTGRQLADVVLDTMIGSLTVYQTYMRSTFSVRK